jgi:hypothetical protein
MSEPEKTYKSELEGPGKRVSVVEHRNSVALTTDYTEGLTTRASWLERTLKPKKYNPRYPFVGKPLLWMTCAFGSLGDALFGYDQGKDKSCQNSIHKNLAHQSYRYHGRTAGQSSVYLSILCGLWRS